MHTAFNSIALAAAVASLPAPARAQATSQGDLLSITLRPETPVNGEVQTFDVTVSTTVPAKPANAPLLTLPTMRDAATTSARDLVGLSVSDAAGVVPLSVEDVQKNSHDSDRLWKAGRAVSGKLTWHYRVSTDPAQPLRALPMYELRSSFGALSGAAVAFLPLPADMAARRVAVHWDLSALPPGSVALSSFGRGEASSHRALSREELFATYYMAGKVGVYSAPDGGFFAGWQGKPGFSMDRTMAWAARLHTYYGRFFKEDKGTFGVFARNNELNPGSGNGFTDSFGFTFAGKTQADELTSLLAHEMLHVWVNDLDDSGPDPLASSWFSEGIAVYYQRELPYRAKAISTQDFLKDLNETAYRYYTDTKFATPNAEIGPNFWVDTRIRVLPYDRGSLYFARLNAQIKRASRGRRSLDDLVLAMLAERRAGRPMNQAKWLALLAAELGKPGVDEWQAMMAGRRVDLATDTFGPCFAKVMVPARLFDTGYDFVATRAHGGIVEGLKPGSEAARAGLRNGDHIVHGGPGDVIQGSPTQTMQLSIERGGQPLAITFLPRGDAVMVPQWKEKRPGEHCTAPRFAGTAQ